jgi:hypothetical protein
MSLLFEAGPGSSRTTVGGESKSDGLKSEKKLEKKPN